MEYSSWAPFYEQIRAEFGFRMERERAAADRLVELLPEAARAPPLPRIRPRLVGRDVVVVGLAPGAGAPPIWRLPASTRPPAIVAADGAAARCLEAGLVPDVITSDLDGPVASEVAAVARGALLVAHAHGDNRPALEEWIPQFDGELAGSWAGHPTATLLNVGGFTDGDRGAFLAAHLGAARVLLWGFEFAEVHEPTPAEAARKRAKLAWTERLLRALARGPVPVWTWRRDATLVPYPPGPDPATTQ